MFTICLKSHQKRTQLLLKAGNLYNLILGSSLTGSSGSGSGIGSGGKSAPKLSAQQPSIDFMVSKPQFTTSWGELALNFYLIFIMFYIS